MQTSVCLLKLNQGIDFINGGSNPFKQWYAYGNYIDEVLIMDTVQSYLLARYYIHDHIYSPVRLIDTSGNTYECYEYDAYGEPIIHASWGDDYTWLTADDVIEPYSAYGNKYLFTGREVDLLNGGTWKLQYNRNRYYDYYTGRWLSQDPIGYQNNLNLYEYVRSNPLFFTDPSGLENYCKVNSDGIWVCNYFPEPGEFGLPPGVIKIEPTPRKIDLPSIGWRYEAHFFAGGGAGSVSCKDDCGKVHDFMYIKFCGGGAAHVGIGGGISNLNGKECRRDKIEGWSYELGGGLGAGSGEVCLGYDDSNWGLPGYPTGICYVNCGAARGIGMVGFKSSWCYYVVVEEKIDGQVVFERGLFGDIKLPEDCTSLTQYCLTRGFGMPIMWGF